MNSRHFVAARRLVAVVAVLMVSTACSKTSAPSPPEKNVQIANPASEYCVKLGGKTQAKKDEAGNAFALCHLPDGTAIEEWELFRRDHPNNG